MLRFTKEFEKFANELYIFDEEVPLALKTITGKQSVMRSLRKLVRDNIHFNDIFISTNLYGKEDCIKLPYSTLKRYRTLKFHHFKVLGIPYTPTTKYWLDQFIG